MTFLNLISVVGFIFIINKFRSKQRLAESKRVPGFRLKDAVVKEGNRKVGENILYKGTIISLSCTEMAIMTFVH